MAEDSIDIPYGYWSLFKTAKGNNTYDLNSKS